MLSGAIEKKRPWRPRATFKRSEFLPLTAIGYIKEEIQVFLTPKKTRQTQYIGFLCLHYKKDKED